MPRSPSRWALSVFFLLSCSSSTASKTALRYINKPTSNTDTSSSVTRIVGGTPVESRDDYPFFCVTVPLGCGCSLIAPDMVLTAAHCISAFSVGTTIHIGGLWKDGSDAQDSIPVKEAFAHPRFDSSSNRYDVMVVKLERATTVVIPGEYNLDATLPLDTDNVVAIGHGRTSEGGVVSSELREVTVPVVDHATCNSNYDGIIHEDLMLCAGTEGMDSCQGDSGGPLLVGKTIVGITSWGYGCARAGNPGVYARVSTFVDFIQATICFQSEAELPDYCEGLTMAPTPSPPNNDRCEDAVELIVGDIVSGSSEHSQAATSCEGSGPGVWYKVSGTGTTMAVSTCAFANFDTVLDVFVGSDCSCDPSVERIFNDDFPCGGTSSLRSQVAFETQEGMDYHIFVSGYNAARGDFELELMDAKNASPPAAPSPEPTGCILAIFCTSWMEALFGAFLRIFSSFLNFA